MNSKPLVSGVQALDKGREKLGQVQILAIMLFLLLIPTTAIIAQNSTNITNITGDVIVDAPAQESALPEQVQDSNQTNTTEPAEPGPFNMTQPENHTNTTNTTGMPTTIPPIPTNYTNQTGNNETEFNETWTNQTINETGTLIPEIPQIPAEPLIPENNTDINQTENETKQEPPEPEPDGLPVIDASIISSDSVTRGEYFEIKARARNAGTGPAKDVWMDWVLPDGFVILTGSGSVYCQEVAPDASCWNNITATVSLSSDLGSDDIRIRVSYAE